MQDRTSCIPRRFVLILLVDIFFGLFLDGLRPLGYVDCDSFWSRNETFHNLRYGFRDLVCEANGGLALC